MMKLKKVGLLLFGVLFLLLLSEVLCAAYEQDHEQNIIPDDSRRAADPAPQKGDDGPAKSDTKKRGLFLTSSPNKDDSRQRTYHSGYGSSGTGHAFSSPSYVYGPTPYGGYPSAHGSYGLTGYEGDGYDHSNHGVSYGHSSGHGGGGHGGKYGGGGFGHHSLALKGLLIPLAGIALLGAAAALSTNPVLLQLGVVNGRKRKRRSLSPRMHGVYPVNPRLRPEEN